MIYPVVNTQALGRATLFPQPSMFLGSPYLSGPVHAPARRMLGQAEQLSLQAARKRYDDAQGVYQRVEKTYPRLVATIGEDDAKQAWQQAQDALKEAQTALEDALAYSQGTGR